MTEDQIKQIRARIATLRQPEHKLTGYYLSGWNEAIAHVEKIIKEELGEKS